MILSSRKLVTAVLGICSVAAVIVACGSADDSKFKDQDPKTGGFLPDGGIGGGDSGPGDDPNGELFKNDPPPAWCGPDAGITQPAIGGTPDCPDDKNKPGCGCLTAGTEADCWTGLRKNRNLGLCKDGRTKCNKVTENENTWGPCVGQVLPKEGASGELACSCFSVGLWKIANTSPCIWSDNGTYWAYSTTGPDASGCTTENHLNAGVKPTAGIWSTDTLKTDCAGSFTLVFRIRVGDKDNPKPTDCILGESEVFADYQKENVEQKLPDLPHWNTTDSACVKKWEVETPDTQSPGYGEMIVKGGQTVRCEAVAPVGNDTEFVFNRVKFCPKICREAANAQNPICVECQLAGQGEF